MKSLGGSKAMIKSMNIVVVGAAFAFVAAVIFGLV
jgi:hypothetical protein